jgi:hypothetical protein
VKFEGVKRALAALGPDAKPLAVQGYVKKSFNLDVSTAVISSYKKELKAKAKKPGPKPPAKQSAPVAANGSRSGGITLEDIQAVKGLVGRVGPDQLKGLIDLLVR